MNNQKGFTSIIVILITILAVGIVGYFFFVKKTSQVTQQAPTKTQTADPKNTPEPSVNLTPTPTSNETANGKIYKNSAYGFEFQYPPNSTVETRQDLNYQYIRLQNYSPTDDQHALTVGKYYLEIFIFDQKMGHKSSQTCAQSVVGSRKVNLGIVPGYRGLGGEGGDAGGIRFALCAERPSIYFYIQGTENDEKGSLVNQIFDSFKFTN